MMVVRRRGRDWVAGPFAGVGGGRREAGGLEVDGCGEVSSS